MIFSINDTGSNEYPYGEKMYLDPYLRPYTKIYSRKIANLNVKGEITKLFEDNIHDLGWANFLKRT